MPWSVQAYLKYRRIVTARSFLRLRAALIAERAGRIGFRDTIDLRMRFPSPADVRIRPRSNDIYTIDEILIEQVYRSAVARVPDARTVVDLGANIGLASLYLAAALHRESLCARTRRRQLRTPGTQPPWAGDSRPRDGVPGRDLGG